MAAAVGLDRAGAIRQALLELVAEGGLHGAAMASLARRAGVATGTIYVHYADKKALILAVYREVKTDLGLAAMSGWDPAASPRERFLGAWRRTYEHLLERPERAAFLLQLEASPYRLAADQVHEQVMHLWADAAQGLRSETVDLPDELLWELGFGPAVTLAARARQDGRADEATLDAVAHACWRAITGGE